MLSRLRVFPCLLAFACLSFASVTLPAVETQTPTAQSAPKLALTGIGQGLADVDGPWQFHLGDDQGWAAPGFDDSTWTQITSDKPWGAQGFGSTVGYGWYRRHITLDPASGRSPELALLIPLIDDAYEIYWNGMLVGRNGTFPPRGILVSFAATADLWARGALAAVCWRCGCGSLRWRRRMLPS